MKGYTQLVRYCDDFIVCFQYKNEAESFGKMLKERLNQFGLKIAEKKSKIIEFGRYAWERSHMVGKKVETFDFLGFTHYCDQSRNGKFKLGRKTAKKKLRQKMKELNQWLKNIRNQMKLADWWKELGEKLTGHYQYYGISGNIEGLRETYRCVMRLAYKWTNRRSQKKSCNWTQFQLFLEVKPLPKPKIYHLTYTLSSL